MKPGRSKPHTHSTSTNLALFRHKMTLYRFNQGVHTIPGGSNGNRGTEPLTLTTVSDTEKLANTEVSRHETSRDISDLGRDETRLRHSENV